MRGKGNLVCVFLKGVEGHTSGLIRVICCDLVVTECTDLNEVADLIFS